MTIHPSFRSSQSRVPKPKELSWVRPCMGSTGADVITKSSWGISKVPADLAPHLRLKDKGRLALFIPSSEPKE